MSEQLFNRAKNAILSEIKKALPRTGELQIKVEAHGGVQHFEQALQDPEVQEALKRKRLSAIIRVINPLNTVVDHILTSLKNVTTEKIVTFQTLEQNADLYYSALKVEQIKREVTRKRVKIRIQTINEFGKVEPPDIVIATIDDVATGKLDNLL